MSVSTVGYLTLDELKDAGMYPSEERMAQGPVAVAECVQEIPCNPCETACRFHAIKVGDPMKGHGLGAAYASRSAPDWQFS